MSKHRHDVAQVREAMEAVCAETPEYADQRARCSYLERGKPTCLDAAILARLGVSTGLLRDLDKEGTRINATRHPLRRRFTEQAWELLTYLQNSNDAGTPWGRIREEAFRPNPYWWRVNRRYALAAMPWLTEETAILPEP